MSRKPYITEEFLIQEKVHKEKTIKEISNEFGYGITTIKRYLKRYNIRKPKYCITKEFLIIEYAKHNKMPREIAKKFGCHCTTILRKLKYYNIPLKKRNQRPLEEYWNYSTEKHKKHYCKTCRVNEICLDNFLHGNQECRSCARKRSSPFYLPEVREKVRKIMLLNNPMKLLAIREKVSKTRKERKCGYIHGRGYEPYSKEFNSKIKEQIRERDNYICQNCGMTQEEHLVIYSRDIEIHHIDYHKQNCSKNNLITLCKICNIRANFNRDYWQEHFTKLIGEIR